ncbi:hypothetical protein GCM10010052_18370 [Paenarthrobacter histidinolovorans]|nr:hypothetical protein GCM10010052_18370 [Paenarthrobacter histidinolovorans]
MPQDHVSQLVKDELLPVEPRRTSGMQDDLNVVRGQPQAANRTTVQSSGSFDLYRPMPNAFDYLNQAFQIKVSREFQAVEGSRGTLRRRLSCGICIVVHGHPR